MGFREWLGVGERRWTKRPNEEVQPAKTLWDWLQLLIVPAILIAVTFAWSATQTRSDNKREDRRIAADRAAVAEARKDATLQGYFDQMSGLMLSKKLLSSENGAVNEVARILTLTTLHRLDGERKVEVIRFLYESLLLDSRHPRVDLTGAELMGVQLADAELSGIDLYHANLTGANLRHASLQESFLSFTNLGRAKLIGADLDAADLNAADLRGADLRGAYLEAADLDSADLRGADLKGADLVRANLDSADVRGANLDGAALDLVAHLDLARFIAALAPERKKAFLDSQKEFLDSLSQEALAKFNLSPRKLAKFRREAKTA